MRAIVLLGWYERDDAVRYLTTDCAFNPPLTEAQAEAMWRPYRDVVEALPDRDGAAPAYQTLTPAEQAARTRFLARHRNSQNIRDVVKVDAKLMVVHQRLVVVEQADQYGARVASMNGWISETLEAQTRSHQVGLRLGPNAMDVDVPHGEFMAVFSPTGTYQIQEMARFVTGTAFDNRLLLWAGYHRSYARTRAIAPDAIDRSLLVVLTTDGEPFVSPASPNQGLRVMVTGRRPPLFGDFFEDRFFIEVPIKPKRFILRVRGQMVPVDV